MSVKPEIDPPTSDPRKADPGVRETKPSTPTEPSRGRSRLSDQTTAALVGAAVTAVGAIVAAFVGISNETIIVPAVDNRPIDLLTEKIDGLQISVDKLSAENDDLEAKVQERDAEIAELEAKGPEPTPSTPSVDAEPAYIDRPLALNGTDESGRTAFAELDGTPVANTMLSSEWNDTRQVGGPTADIGTYGTFHGDELAWSRTGTWYSEASAPADFATCSEGASSSDKTQVTLDFLAAGDVICLLTTDDAIARLTVTKVDAESSPGSVEFSASLWE